MAETNCKNICKLCDKFIISTTVAFVGGSLVINIPEGSYEDGEKYCIVVAQPIPDTTTINAPVNITIGTGLTLFPLTSPCCEQVNACAIRYRTKYSTVVHTSATGATFRLLSMPCCNHNNNLPAVDETI